MMNRSAMRLHTIVIVAVIAAWTSACLAAPLLAQPQTFTPEVSPVVFGNRIPQYYFVTAGAGDTDIGPGEDPWETGSYDFALLEAQIANFNVVPYTSVLPPEAKEVTLDVAEKYFHHGAVVEVIMAKQNGCRYDTLVTGVGRIFVRNKVTGDQIGGFAAEYEKVYPCNAGAIAAKCEDLSKKCEPVPEDKALKEAREMLETSLNGEVDRRYENHPEVERYGMTFETKYKYVKQTYGTSLTALAWVTYIYPQWRNL